MMMGLSGSDFQIFGCDQTSGRRCPTPQLDCQQGRCSCLRRDFDICTAEQKNLVDPHTDKVWTNNDTKDCRAFLIFYRRNGQGAIVLIFQRINIFISFVYHCLQTFRAQNQFDSYHLLLGKENVKDFGKIDKWSRETMQWRRCNKMPNIWVSYSIVSNLRSNIFAPKSMPYHKKQCSVKSWSALSANEQ